jgi:phospholipid transport system substrate-binding protein
MVFLRSAIFAIFSLLAIALPAHAQSSAEDLVRRMAIDVTAEVRKNPTSTEQRQIVSEFSKLLVRTYSNALASLKDLDVQVRDSRKNGNEVTVRTQMIGRAKPVAIDYSLESSGGGWRVYDVTVEGLSLVTTYRDDFNGMISSSGVPGLIASLKQKNNK